MSGYPDWMKPDSIAAMHEAILILGQDSDPIQKAKGRLLATDIVLQTHEFIAAEQRLDPLRGTPIAAVAILHMASSIVTSMFQGMPPHLREEMGKALIGIFAATVTRHMAAQDEVKEKMAERQRAREAKGGVSVSGAGFVMKDSK